jgi:putative pre-16S rRNA nuclease
MHRGSAQNAGTRKVHVMPRILGLDHGERRTGVAVSDPLGVTAQPVEEIVVSSAEELIDRVSALVHEYDVARVVVGHPRNMDGSVGARARSVEAFASRLATAIQPVPVELVDERLSTWEASQRLRSRKTKPHEKKTALNLMAARVILQSYLDQHDRDRS